MSASDMTTRPRAKVHNRRRNVLWSSQPLVRRCVRKLLCPARQLHQSIRHLCREETRRDRIAEDSLRRELDGQVACDVQSCGFRGAVGECGILA